jgi:D-lactate dehydrogenase (cytochrome)
VPRPAVCYAFATFTDPARALAFVSTLRDEARRTWQGAHGSGLDVSAIEHMDGRSLSLLREDSIDKRLGITLDAQAAIGLLVAVDLAAGTTSSEAYAAFAGQLDSRNSDLPLARFATLLEELGANDALIAPPGDATAIDRLLALREAVPVAVNRRVQRAQQAVDARIEKTAADVIVPFARIGELLSVWAEELRVRGLDGAVWGHVSDGNFHPNVIPRTYADVESGREAVLAIGRAAIRLGGSPLAEHGVGRNPTKQRLLRELYGEDGIRQMRAVKSVLDPAGKLAPGVIFG